MNRSRRMCRTAVTLLAFATISGCATSTLNSETSALLAAEGMGSAWRASVEDPPERHHRNITGYDMPDEVVPGLCLARSLRLVQNTLYETPTAQEVRWSLAFAGRTCDLASVDDLRIIGGTSNYNQFAGRLRAVFAFIQACISASPDVAVVSIGCDFPRGNGPPVQEQLEWSTPGNLTAIAIRGNGDRIEFEFANIAERRRTGCCYSMLRMTVDYVGIRPTAISTESSLIVITSMANLN